MTRPAIGTIVALMSAAHLGGCAPIDHDADGPAALAHESVITGALAYRERIALAPDARIDVVLADISIADAPMRVVARETRDAAGRQVPLPFTLRADPAKLAVGRRYVVRATIRSATGDPLWTTDASHPVDPAAGPRDLGTLVLVRVAKRDAQSRSGVMNRRPTLPDRAIGPKIALSADIINREWVVEDVEGRGVIDDSRLTLTFSDNGRLSGRAGCNGYSGLYAHDGQRFVIRRLTVSSRACAPALMALEASFLRALQTAGSVAIGPDGKLKMTSAGGVAIVAR